MLIDSGAERCLSLSISVNLFNIFNLEHNSTFPNFACKNSDAWTIEEQELIDKRQKLWPSSMY